MNVFVKFKRVRETSKLPQYQTEQAACADVYADVQEPLVIESGSVAIVPTGLIADIPQGFEIQLRARSGLSVKGVSLSNGIGTVDSDYTQEIGAIIANRGPAPFIIRPGDRIAQMTVAPVYRMIVQETLEEIEAKGNRTGGFGSTGK